MVIEFDDSLFFFSSWALYHSHHRNIDRPFPIPIFVSQTSFLLPHVHSILYSFPVLLILHRPHHLIYARLPTVSFLFVLSLLSAFVHPYWSKLLILKFRYIVRLLGWARKYGLRVNLDLHTAPGSQNGYNHSGKLGQVNFLRGVMGYANAERMLGYIRIITEFISQDEWKDVVPMFGIINEALESQIGKDELSRL